MNSNYTRVGTRRNFPPFLAHAETAFTHGASFLFFLFWLLFLLVALVDVMGGYLSWHQILPPFWTTLSWEKGWLAPRCGADITLNSHLDLLNSVGSSSRMCGQAESRKYAHEVWADPQSSSVDHRIAFFCK